MFMKMGDVGTGQYFYSVKRIPVTLILSLNIGFVELSGKK